MQRLIMQGPLLVTVALTAVLSAWGEQTVASKVDGLRADLAGINGSNDANVNRPRTTVTGYDDFQKPRGYTLADYSAKWTTTLGRGEMVAPS
jgi:hypothetical protein